MQLTQKAEVSLLKDMRNQEKLCIDKYSKYAAEAHDPQLRQLFDSIAGTERAHLDMLNQIEAGQSPHQHGYRSGACLSGILSYPPDAGKAG